MKKFKYLSRKVRRILNKNCVLFTTDSEYLQESPGSQKPLNLLFFNVFKWATKQKIKVYDFGTFTVDGAANMGLGRFKENFGASGVFRDSFQILF